MSLFNTTARSPALAGLFCATVLSAAAAMPALAGEGAGDPFPLVLPGQIVTAAAQAFDVGQSALPALPQAYSFAYNGEPTNTPSNSEAEVLTANSLPRDALAGTVQYTQEQSITRWFAARRLPQNVFSARSFRQGS